MTSFFSKERIVAEPGFNRWRIPPASIGIHLCIGSVYAWSIFNSPLMRIEGVVGSSSQDWTLRQVVWIFTVAIVCLGLAASVAGKWIEKVGPRTVGIVAAACWGSGFLVGAVGIHLHQLWLLYLGYGVIGGIGLGLGYVSPVSTLVKWFPDRPGLATGLAIMGFGGGAMIGGPLASNLMAHYKAVGQPSIPYTMITMGILYFIFMMFGVFTIRVPRDGWKPEGWVPSTKHSALISDHNVA